MALKPGIVMVCEHLGEDQNTGHAAIGDIINTLRARSNKYKYQADGAWDYVTNSFVYYTPQTKVQAHGEFISVVKEYNPLYLTVPHSRPQHPYYRFIRGYAKNEKIQIYTAWYFVRLLRQYEGGFGI